MKIDEFRAAIEALKLNNAPHDIAVMTAVDAEELFRGIDTKAGRPSSDALPRMPGHRWIGSIMGTAVFVPL